MSSMLGSREVGAPATPTHPPRADGEARRWADRLFDETAPDYDGLDTWMSLGASAVYRRRALRAAGLARGMRVLDLAMGTGALSRAALDLLGPGGRVVGVDPSRGMLAEARKTPGIAPVRGV